MKKLNPTEINKEINIIRSKITDLKDEIEWVEGSCPPKKEVYEQFSKIIDVQTEEFSFNPKMLDIFHVHGTSQPYNGTKANMGPLLCGLFGEQIKESIKYKIDALDYEEGPATAEKADLVKELNSNVLKLEQRQEELIVMADSVGVQINRSNGFDPAVVLGFTS